MKGNKQDIQRAFDYFEEAYRKEPENPMIAAYYGDCVSLAARGSTEPTALFSNAITAMKLLDGAVNARPEAIDIRLLRARHSFRLPESFFRRTATAISDFEFILNEYQQDSSVLPMENFLEILYLLGKCHERMGMVDEMTERWNQLLEAGKDSEYALLVHKELEGKAAAEYAFDVNAIDDMKKLFKEGLRLHNLAVDGNAEAAIKARDVLKRVYEKNGQLSLVEAYYGSSIALAGKYASESQTMFGSAIQGMKLLNHAITNDNHNAKLRYLRGNLFYNLPEAFFHTNEKAIGDFSYAATACEKDSSVLPKEKYWEVLYFLGNCYERAGDLENAAKVWNKLLSRTTDETYKTLLSNKVKGGINS